MRSRILVPAAVAVAVLLAGCADSDSKTTSTTTNSQSETLPGNSSAEGTPRDSIVGTVIRFSAADGAVDVTIDQDNPAARDLLTMLPFTLTFEDFAGKEKIAYPPRDIRFAGSPPASGGAGDLAIYTPWGNLAFYYEGTPGTPSDQLVHLGTFDESRTNLDVLESGQVTVTVVE